jgi:hypothetical protein
VRGGNALVGAADIILEINRLSTTADPTQRLRVLSCIGRFDETEDLVLELNETGWAALGTEDEVRSGRQRAELIDALREFAEPATTGEVADKLEIAEGTVRGRLHALHRSHEVIRVGSGKKGDPHRWSLPPGGTET